MGLSCPVSELLGPAFLRGLTFFWQRRIRRCSAWQQRRRTDSISVGPRGVDRPSSQRSTWNILDDHLDPSTGAAT